MTTRRDDEDERPERERGRLRKREVESTRGNDGTIGKNIEPPICPSKGDGGGKRSRRDAASAFDTR
jgi:hypothetical protein